MGQPVQDAGAPVDQEVRHGQDEEKKVEHVGRPVAPPDIQDDDGEAVGERSQRADDDHQDGDDVGPVPQRLRVN